MARVEARAAARCRTACAALALFATAFATGCGERETDTSTFEGTNVAWSRDARPRDDSPAVPTKRPDAECPTPTALRVHHDGAGRVDRVHATLTARGIEGPYLVDTGSLSSYTTNISSEEEADTDAKSAATTLACKEMTLPIIGRLRPGATPDGTPQVGVLGADLVAHARVIDLDLKKSTLGWYEPAPVPPPGSVVLPIERRKGWLVVSGVRVSGRAVKLVVDTGATNVILLDGTPREGEIREDTVDGTASPITLFHGAGEISFAGGVDREIPIDRTDQFPTLQGLVSELGSDVAGLLGITAMGSDRIIISRDSLTMVLPRVVEPRAVRGRGDDDVNARPRLAPFQISVPVRNPVPVFF